MQLKYVIALFLLILFVYWLSGCSYTVQLNTDYATQSGDGSISESVTDEATTEQTPTVDIQADIPEGL